MTEPSPEQTLTADQQTAMDQLFKVLPSEYNDLVSALNTLSRSFRLKVAQTLEPRLNEYYGALRHDTFDYRRHVGIMIDRTTTDLGLCVTHQGEPVLIAAERSGPHDSGRYIMLQPDNTYKGFHKGDVSTTLPKLKLDAAPESTHEVLQAARDHAYKPQVSGRRR